MTNEPEMPAHPYPALNKRLQKSDKESEIEIYFKLLSAGHSVGEILSCIDLAQSKMERGNTAITAQPHSRSDVAEPDRVAIDLPSEAALAELAQGNTRRTSRSNVLDNAERHGIAEPQAELVLLNELGADNRDPLPRKSVRRSGPGMLSPAGAHSSKGWEAATYTGSQERPQSSRFPSTAKRIAFGVLYTAAVASVSIAGFSIVRGYRNTEPAITRAHSDISSGAEASVIPGPIAEGPTREGSEAVEAVEPKTQELNTDALPAPKPSRPGEPASAAAGPSQPISVGVRETVPSPRQGAEARRSSNTGQPTPLDVQFPSITSAGPAETVPLANAGQPDESASSHAVPEATAEDKTKAVATVPAGKLSATWPPRAHVVGRREASTARRHIEPKKYAGRRTSLRSLRSAYYGQRSGSYDVDRTRGYGNGAYGPAPYSEAGN